MSQTVDVLIKFVDAQLKSDDVVTEVYYLIEDLRDLQDMHHVRFEAIPEIRDVVEINVGIKFEADSEQLVSILRRLRDRLYYNSVETLFLFRIADVSLQIQTHKADDLMGFMAAAQSGLLFSPERDYLAEAETYSRTQGELSPTELDNLNLLRQRLGLSAEQAQLLNARAVGPYTTQAEKRRLFDEITAAEFSRLRQMDTDHPFAPQNPWPVLQELAENLALPIPEAEAMYQKHWRRYRDEAKLKTEQQAAKTTEDARLTSEARAEAARQQQAQQTHKYRDQYRTLCRQAMANSLYPSEYDQGRLDQARRLLDIAPEDALSTEAAVRDELYGSVESAVGVDYSRLRSLLHQKDWQAADLETEAAILKALDCEMQPATAATVQRLPAIDVATINGLWSRYSGGRFGFKAQQQIYRSQQNIQADEGRRWLAFQEALGWREPPSLFYRGVKPYYNLTFSPEAPPGHLPTWRWGCPSPNHRYSPSPEIAIAIMEHLNHCLPLDPAGTAALDPTAVAGGLVNAS